MKIFSINGIPTRLSICLTEYNLHLKMCVRIGYQTVYIRHRVTLNSNSNRSNLRVLCESAAERCCLSLIEDSAFMDALKMYMKPVIWIFFVFNFANLYF